MATVKVTTPIEARPEAVWSVLNDLPRIPEYVFFVREVYDISEGPTGEGTTYRERAKPGPVESESEWRIKVFEPTQRQVHEGTMPEMHANLTMELTPQNGGTRFTQVMDFEFLPKIRPLGALLEKLVVERKMKADLKRVQENLKQIVEAEATR